MSKEKCFYQDFLFEDLPVDEQDNPLVDLTVSTDSKDTGCVVISFDKDANLFSLVLDFLFIV